MLALQGTKKALGGGVPRLCKFFSDLMSLAAPNRGYQPEASPWRISLAVWDVLAILLSRLYRTTVKK
jgi:hypothetical protein